MKWLLGFALLFVGSALLPFAGPTLGLTSYESRIEQEGQSLLVTAGALNVQQHRGDGRTVVLVHGHPGSAQMMKPLAEALARRGYGVVRYDRMGWGYSGQRPPDQPANPTAHAKDLLDLVEMLELQAPLFVGYSYGGGVVMEANLAASAQVRDIVLLSSVGKPRALVEEPGLLSRVTGSPLFLRWAFGTDTTMNLVAGALSQRLMVPESPLPGELEGFLASLSLPNVPTNWRRESRERTIGFEGYRPQGVRACTLILHGADDQVVRMDTAEFLASAIPNARLERMDRAGHGMLIAQPERLAAAIARHEQRCGRG